ncbi:hypothetical protein EMIHUDRAFT_471796, partial [Emiliania huxleyi CCMP1516]|uniref:NAD-dependent epimerase/dehydratase domain-containing protein n=2 Tax=Emiliania huxleyi TaxID=2903 RepID=A0A0D3I962_EMIH1
MRDVALLLALLRAAPAAGKGLHEHDGGAGGRDGRRTKPWRASEACVATGGAAPSVAIIGAGGNIGSRLHEVLSANCGWKVTGYDREPRLSPPRAKYPITPMSAASIPAAELAAYDAVVYLGGLTGRAACDRHTREQTLSENVDDPLALASRMGPSQLLVFASTSAITEGSGQRSAREDTAVRTELLDSYSSSMHQREAAMRQLAASKPAGAPQLVGLRFGTVIGVSPGQRVDLGPPAMLKSAYTTGVLKVAHPETSRAFLWLEDLCRGISRTIELRRGGAAIAPPATAHHSKRSAPSSSSMAPAAPPPFAIYHL